jgi:hypothetical protein
MDSYTYRGRNWTEPYWISTRNAEMDLVRQIHQRWRGNRDSYELRGPDKRKLQYMTWQEWQRLHEVTMHWTAKYMTIHETEG